MTTTNSSKKTINAAWFTWEVQIRNRSMANCLGIHFYELVSKRSRLVKYPLLILKTIYLIFVKRINLVFAQNPSIVLSLIVTLIGKVTTKKIVIDAHNAGVYPLEGKSAFLNAVAKFIIRNADLVIVSNSYLAKVVEEWGGKSFVMPDPLPNIEHEISTSSDSAAKYFFFICTWADDEPYNEVISAAKLIPGELNIYISGNYRKRFSEDEASKFPANVKLLGFVSEHDYVGYLSHAIAGIDLTTRDHCLVCGAYESIALGTPCVISESKINREIFPQGFIYTQNDALSISQALIQANSRRLDLIKEMTIQKRAHNQDIAEKVKKLKVYLSMPESV